VRLVKARTIGGGGPNVIFCGRFIAI